MLHRLSSSAPSFDPASQGFDDVFTAKKPEDELSPPPPDAHAADEITARAIKFIEDHRAEPSFCYVPHNVVHRPLYEEEQLIEQYRRKPGADLPIHNPIMGAMIERMDTGIGRVLETLDRLKLTEKTVVMFVSDNGGLEALQSQAPPACRQIHALRGRDSRSDGHSLAWRGAAIFVHE